MTQVSKNAAARVSHKTGVEEKGQRSVKSTDVYLPKSGLKESAVCRKCRLVYHNKRWVLNEAEARRLLLDKSAHTGICPSCRRMGDDNPGGLVTLSGGYLREHMDDILNLLKHAEAKSREKNPLGRIMEIREEKGVLTVSTTEDKLAQKLGREVYKAHKGELLYQWSHDQSLVRVNWKR